MDIGASKCSSGPPAGHTPATSRGCSGTERTQKLDRSTTTTKDLFIIMPYCAKEGRVTYLYGWTLHL